MSTSPDTWTIFLIVLATKTFHDFPGFEIQYSAAMLPIQIVTDWTFLRCLTKILCYICGRVSTYQLQSCNWCASLRYSWLWYLEPFKFKVPCWIIATAAVEQAEELGSASWWMSTASTVVLSRFRLLGIFTSRSCIVLLFQPLAKDGENSAFQLLLSSHASLYRCFPSTTVEDMVPSGSQTLPSWLSMVLFISGVSSRDFGTRITSLFPLLY